MRIYNRQSDENYKYALKNINLRKSKPGPKQK